MTVSEISKQTKLSHPAVVQLTNKMKDKGYLESTVDPKDGRKYLLKLTAKVEEELPALQQCWEACNKTMIELTKGKTLIFEVLKDMESQMEEADYKTRTERNMNKL